MNKNKILLTIIYLALLLLCFQYIFTELEELSVHKIITTHLLAIWSIASLYMLWLFFEVASLYVLTGKRVSRFYLLKIYLIGEAYNCLTPLLGYGGDPLRVHYLQKEIGLSQASQAIILFKYIDMAAAVTVGLLAQIIAVLTINDIPALWQKILLVSIILFVVLLTLLLLGLFKNVTYRLSDFFTKSFALDLSVPQHTNSQKWQAYGYQCSSRIFVAFEIWLATILLSYTLSFAEVVFMLSFCSLSTVYFFFIPNGIGSNEALLSQSTQLLGYGSMLGLFVALVRRIRSISWALLGLLLHFAVALYRRQTSVK